jgi:hypothetical protein
LLSCVTKLIIAKIWDHLKCPFVDEKLKKMLPHFTLYSATRKGNPVICNNMSETGGHYDK